MLVHACSQIFFRSVEIVAAPYGEAKRQIQLTISLPQTDSSSIDPPNLTGRVTHLAIGALLLFPGFNYIFYIAMYHFGFDLGHRLCMATKQGQLDELQFYFDIGWNPNYQIGGKSLLFTAYESGNLDTFKKVLANKDCDPNAMHEGKTLLHLAAEEQDEEKVDLLLERGANANIKRVEDLKTAALIIYEKGNVELALKIAKIGNGVNDLCDRRGNILLNYAWNRKDIPMILGLIELGACPPEKHQISHFELFQMVFNHKSELAIQMTDAGWDVNCQNDLQQTPLLFAAQKKQWKTARKLVEQGAKLKTMDVQEIPAIKYGTYTRDRDYINYFLMHPEVFPSEFFSLKNYLPGETYLNWVMPEIVKRCQERDINPLEVVYFTGSDTAIQALSRCLTFTEFNQALIKLQNKYPQLLTSWIFNALFSISAEHYSTSREIKVQSDHIRPPEGPGFYNEIMKTFKGINFSDEMQPLYRGIEARKFDGEVYTTTQLAEHLTRLITSVRDQKALQGIPPNEKERKVLYQKLQTRLRHIAYLLTLPSISQATKIDALLDLSYRVKSVRNWPDALYRTYCRLSGETYQELTFEDKMMLTLRETRLAAVKEIFSEDELDYALYRLTNSKKLPGDPPQIDKNKLIQIDPEAEFNHYYLPSSMIKWIFEKHVREPFFNADMHDWCEEKLTGKWIESDSSNLLRVMHSTDEAGQFLPLSLGIILQRTGHLKLRDSKTFAKSFS